MLEKKPGLSEFNVDENIERDDNNIHTKGAKNSEEPEVPQ